MKTIKILSLLLFVLLAHTGMAQKILPYNGFAYEFKRLMGDSALGLPRDTFAIPAQLQDRTHLAGRNDSLFIWSPATGIWELFAGGGGGGASFYTTDGSLAGLTRTVTTDGTTVVSFTDGAGYYFSFGGTAGGFFSYGSDDGTNSSYVDYTTSEIFLGQYSGGKTSEVSFSNGMIIMQADSIAKVIAGKVQFPNIYFSSGSPRPAFLDKDGFLSSSDTMHLSNTDKMLFRGSTTGTSWGEVKIGFDAGLLFDVSSSNVDGHITNNFSVGAFRTENIVRHDDGVDSSFSEFSMDADSIAYKTRFNAGRYEGSQGYLSMEESGVRKYVTLGYNRYYDSSYQSPQLLLNDNGAKLGIRNTADHHLAASPRINGLGVTTAGEIKLDIVGDGTGGDDVLVRGSDSLVKKIPIGSLPNMATANLTLTGDREHTLGSNYMYFLENDDWENYWGFAPSVQTIDWSLDDGNKSTGGQFQPSSTTIGHNDDSTQVSLNMSNASLTSGLSMRSTYSATLPWEIKENTIGSNITSAYIQSTWWGGPDTKFNMVRADKNRIRIGNENVTGESSFDGFWVDSSGNIFATSLPSHADTTNRKVVTYNPTTKQFEMAPWFGAAGSEGGGGEYESLYLTNLGSGDTVLFDVNDSTAGFKSFLAGSANSNATLGIVTTDTTIKYEVNVSTTALTTQTLYGSSSSAGNLNLASTSHSTKGKIILADSVRLTAHASGAESPVMDGDTKLLVVDEDGDVGTEIGTSIDMTGMITGDLVEWDNTASVFKRSPRAFGNYVKLADVSLATTGTVIPFDTENEETGLTHSTSSNPEEITVTHAGTYRITVNLQVKTVTAGEGAMFGLQKYSGGFVNLAGSSIYVTIPTVQSMPVSLSYIVTLAAGDKIRVVGSVTSTDVSLLYIAATMGLSAVPAARISIQKL